jgi:ribosomal protein S28E/S33
MNQRAFDIVYLEPDGIRFHREGDTLRMQLLDGRDYARVVLRSCFPVHDSDVLLSVWDATSEEQEEIGIIRDWRELCPEDREAVAAEMNLNYFVPVITRVKDIRSEFGFLYWDVDTDKGPLEFAMRDSVAHYAREISPTRWILIDINQARYEIRDLDTLDERSQRLVVRELRL